MNSRPTAARETAPVYKKTTLGVSAFESSSSTLGGNGVGQQKSQNELSPRINQNRGATMNNFTDFFSQEVFQIVLHNPTTSHRFMKFCQSRACSENVEFLQKVCYRDIETQQIRVEIQHGCILAICYTFTEYKKTASIPFASLVSSVVLQELLLQ